MLAVAIRLSRCKVVACKAPFQKQRPFQTWCSPECGLVIFKQREKVDERVSDGKRREALKTKPELLEEAQVAFRKWVRVRDEGKPCICCGRFPMSGEALTGGQWDGGHFRSRGACPELAFDERNCHAQLKRCNGQAWDVASYRANLRLRIGDAELTELEGPHPPKHYTRDDLRALRDHYRAATTALKRARKNLNGTR